jgi:hypothetical protein
LVDIHGLENVVDLIAFELDLHLLEHELEFFFVEVAGIVGVNLIKENSECGTVQIHNCPFQLIEELLFISQGVLTNRSSFLSLRLFLTFLLLHLLFEHIEFTQEGVQCDVTATFVFEEVINETLNVTVRDVLTLELVEELFEILLRDVALTFLVNELEYVRLLPLKALHCFDNVEDHGLFEGSGLETFSLEHEAELFMLNEAILVFVHLINKHLNVAV